MENSIENKAVKRTRAPNCSAHENFVLLDLVENHKEIIENKKTDGVSLKTKEKTWEKIAQEFGCVPGTTQRTSGNLKSVYENLKRKARRANADDKVQLYKTGGGPAQSSKLGDVDKRVLQVISSNNLTLESPYDSDHYYGTIIEPTPSGRPTLETDPLSLSSPIETLESIVNGDFCEILESQVDAPTPKPSGMKHISRKILAAKRKKITATEAISRAAVLQADTMNSDAMQKKEQHEITMQLKREKIELIQMKKEIANETLKYWKRLNSNF